MAADPNWSRWIKASTFKALQDAATAAIPGLLVYKEAEVRKTNQEQAWVELRMDGPFAQERTMGQWHLEVDLDVLCMQNVDRDLYHIDRLIGVAMAALVERIPVYKYGSDPRVDDQTLLFCLTQDTKGVNDGVHVHQFGQTDSKILQVQASVSAKYYVDI